MNPITQPLELQAAAFRVAGYAMVSQIKIMQIMARSALELPMAPVHALHNTASKPAPAEAKPVATKAAGYQACSGDPGQETCGGQAQIGTCGQVYRQTTRCGQTGCEARS